jgi:two-component system, NarL family, sensor histidine kinase UhpB
MRGLSLKAQLSWLIGFALLLTLLLNLLIQILHAGPRVRAEVGSNLKLMREFVLVVIGNLPENEDPRPALQRLYVGLGKLRHSSLQILAANETPSTNLLQTIRRPDSGIPDWFMDLVGVSPRVLSIPVILGGRTYGNIVVVSNPYDELEEVWSDMVWLASISGLVIFVILTSLLLYLRVSLASFDTLLSGLAQLQAGKRGVHIAPTGATEFRRMSNAFNLLGATLDRVTQENRKLVVDLMNVQDSERKEIARDLHDEAGPCLFSIRAAVATLQEQTCLPVPDFERIRRSGEIINRASESLQALFRGLLERLRPKGLAELGLSSALEALVESWKISHPGVALQLALPHDLSSLDETTAFTAYRIVQEGMTNIFRHANADRAEVRLEFGPGPRERDTEGANCAGLRVIIDDNGVGISEPHKPGVGLLGMSERVQALGGVMKIERREEEGMRISVFLPLLDEGGEA